MTGTYSATTVPMKGSMRQFVIDKVMDSINEIGDAKQVIIRKTDQEPSVTALVQDVVKERESGRTVVRNPERKQQGLT